MTDDPIASMHLLTTSTGYVWRLRHLLWTANAGQTWKNITPPLQPNQIMAGVNFLDAEHGWAVLKDSGIVTDAQETPNSLDISVAATIDGGNSWSVVTLLEDASLTYTGGSPIFVDDTHGWLLLDIQGSSASSAANLFTTSNGGATWSALPQLPVDGSIRFFPDGTGWLCGGVHQDELYRTRDGGQSWTRKIMALPPNVKPYTMPDGSPAGIYVMHATYTGPYFSTEQKGIVLVSVPVSERKAPLLTYTTEDGGDSWQLQKMDSEFGLGPVTAEPAFFDSAYMEVGSVGGTASGIAFFRFSTEETVKALSTRLPHKHSVVNHADFVDRLHGWLLMSDQSLLGTSDGGKTLLVLLQSNREKTHAADQRFNHKQEITPTNVKEE